ncbi:MAG TPA: type II toxin-antitoxin system RelE/ParE family toxin [Kofleriaceae bacterium]|nr:type II toxin-antitoxin system RelE/ParE family toxin [Kofleriaceae bacterium]
MKVRFSARALAEAKRIKTWWRRNRRAAPHPFEQELKAALARIRATPDRGIAYQPGRFEVPVRRALLPRSRHHVYYAAEQRVAVVLSVWGAQQGQDPLL